MRIITSIFIILMFTKSYACTILSGVDANGHVWACNNEDFFFTFKNYINVHPSTSKNTLGYFTLTYGEPTSDIEGGVNEAGLFFDFNMLPEQEFKLRNGRKPFPGGREAMLTYILSNCKTVPDVLNLWKTYYRPGMSSGQMHLADAKGNLVVITPDSIIWSKKGYMVSTNFTLCDPDPVKYKCWRYPIAERLFSTEGVKKETFIKIADSTCQRHFGATNYTNLHDLTTGDFWFFYGEDYATTWHTNIHDLIKQGNRSIIISSLFPQNHAVRLYKALKYHPSENEVAKFLKDRSTTPIQKESALRLCYTNYLLMEKDIARANLIFNPWLNYLSYNKNYSSRWRDPIAYERAREAAFTGDYNIARRIIDTLSQVTNHVRELKNSLEQGSEKPYNVSLRLNGYKQAKSIFVEVAEEPTLYRFLNKTEDGWKLNFNSNLSHFSYIFYVDGKRVNDPENREQKLEEDLAGKYVYYNIYSPKHSNTQSKTNSR